ncbi:MAG: GDSL-type esterase/lipase family protein [Cyclobacteriaceae bacterium]
MHYLHRVLSPFLFCLFIYFHTSGQNEVQSEWKGFKRLDFQLKQRECRLVLPPKPLPGNPWVWRARFPDWHTEADSILLSEGFHVAYINTNNEFGSPTAMSAWDAFYSHLTSQYGLSEKVALAGVSRGGLFVYSWAKLHPERVSCIYAEAPVCNFKSWPGGQFSGVGSENDWVRLKEAYGFASDKEAGQYLNNPIENLEKLADAKIPVLHMIGLNDKIVPPSENTMVLVDRYIGLGGPASVVPCTKGIQKLNGHHFPIETPRLVADFIKYNTEIDRKLDASNYHTSRSGLKNAQITFERLKRGRVAFLGGSITHNHGWRDSVMWYLKKRFPETDFEFIAAGIPSMGTTPAAFRLHRDILGTGPVDLLFEEAAVNDATNGRSDTEQVRGMEGIVRNVRQSNPSTDIVIMHFVDPDKMSDYRQGIVPAVIRNHEKVAQHYNIPTINLAKEVTERIDNKEFTWEDDFKNLHPSPFGQQVYARSMITLLENAFSGHLDPDDKITAHVQQPKIDPYSYDNGSLIEAVSINNTKKWRSEPNWEPSTKVGTRPNYTNIPMLIGDNNSGILTFKFSGESVGIAVAAGPDAGIIEYRLDKGEWKEQDLFTKWSKHLHLPWYFTLSSELPSGEHKLEIRLKEEKNSESTGNMCRIRYFYTDN